MPEGESIRRKEDEVTELRRKIGRLTSEISRRKTPRTSTMPLQNKHIRMVVWAVQADH